MSWSALNLLKSFSEITNKYIRAVCWGKRRLAWENKQCWNVPYGWKRTTLLDRVFLVLTCTFLENLSIFNSVRFYHVRHKMGLRWAGMVHVTYFSRVMVAIVVYYLYKNVLCFYIKLFWFLLSTAWFIGVKRRYVIALLWIRDSHFHRKPVKNPISSIVQWIFVKRPFWQFCFFEAWSKTAEQSRWWVKSRSEKHVSSWNIKCL